MFPRMYIQDKWGYLTLQKTYLILPSFHSSYFKIKLLEYLINPAKGENLLISPYIPSILSMEKALDKSNAIQNVASH